jgi:hypothetical protein
VYLKGFASNKSNPLPLEIVNYKIKVTGYNHAEKQDVAFTRE